MCVCVCVCGFICVGVGVGGATERVCVVNLSVGGCIYLHAWFIKVVCMRTAVCNVTVCCPSPGRRFW